MSGLEGAAMKRVLGRVDGRRDGGPLLVVTAGLHGNEPAGLHAVRRVLRTLAEQRIELEGRFAAFVGNVAALARGVRFVDEDMNRVWSLDAIERADPARDHSEQRERRELLALIEDELARPAERVTHLDLHSTSSVGPPFTVVAGPPQSRAAALAIGAPLLSGLEGVIGGTLIEWMGRRGHAAVVLEGGQNDAPETIDHHESAIWLALVHGGVLDARRVSNLDEHRSRIACAASGVKGEVEIVHRHQLQPGEEFAMLPGFTNFDFVCEGQLLARSGPGLTNEVRAPWNATLIMPRYQGQGLDGFFLGRSVVEEHKGALHQPSRF